MRFRGDDRAVSNVIGAALLLAFLVILLSVYQAQVVPAENNRVEFEHSQIVQNDMLELRNAILESDSAGRSTYATVKLGTRYPNRLIGINPAAPSGTLQTGEARSVTVVDGAGNAVTNLCPAGGPIQTRTLSYSPDYNEYQNPPRIVYENTVLYLNFSGEVIPLTDQQLVQGDRVNINPLNTTFRESGIELVSVEPEPGLVRTKEVQNANISYPTELGEEHWEELLAGEVQPSNVTVAGGKLSIETGGEVSVVCSPIGLNEAPAGGSRVDDADDINPAGPNTVRVQAFQRPSNDVVAVTFNNTADDDANVTEARIAFYNNPSDTGGDIGPLDMINQDGTTVARLEILGPRKTLAPELNFPGNETQTTITFENAGGEKFSQDDFFIVQFVYANGQQGTYFIDIPA